jgi:hypothetical protein
MQSIKIFAITLVLLACGCGPQLWVPPTSQPTAPKSPKRMNASWSQLPEFDGLSCFSPHQCHDKAYCDRQKIDAPAHQLPTYAHIEVKSEAFLMYFKWSEHKQPKFIDRQAYIMSLNLYNRQFAKHRSTHRFSNDYMTNLPCSFKYLPYTKYMSKEYFERTVSHACRIPRSTLAVQKTYAMKRAQERANDAQQKMHLSVGSMCPEKIVANKWYFILYYFKPGTHKTTMAQISSQVIDDVPQLKAAQPKNYELQKEWAVPLSRCPYLYGIPSISQNGKHFQCGRYSKKVWLDRLCIPTKKYRFTPGVDTKNESRRQAHCVDTPRLSPKIGDNDLWFSKAVSIKHDNIRTPITYNMSLHGSHIGDCDDNIWSGNRHTYKCNWYNLGHVAAQVQCYDSNDDNSHRCFADHAHLHAYDPTALLSAFYTQSKRIGHHPGSYDNTGTPTSWVHKWGDGLIQYFNYGAQRAGALMGPYIGAHAPSNFYWVGADFWELYMFRFNQGIGPLGYPVSNVQRKPHLREQHFQLGWIRKYDGQQKYLVKINGQPERWYRSNCLSTHDCIQKDAVCVNYFCIDKHKTRKGRYKKCSFDGQCFSHQKCVQHICQSKSQQAVAKSKP